MILYGRKYNDASRALVKIRTKGKKVHFINPKYSSTGFSRELVVKILLSSFPAVVDRHGFKFV